MMFSYPQYLNLKWKCGNTKHVPQFGSRGVDGDIYDGKIYVKNTNHYQQDIEVQSPEEDKWDLHREAPRDLINFAMAMMNGQLVLTGGIIVQRYSCSSTTNTQDRVAIWNETSQTWEYP